METSTINLNKYKISNNYTTLEQSEELLKLGLSTKTADMYYFCDPTPAGNVMIPTLIIIEKHFHSRLPEYNRGDVPCWTLDALLKLLRSYNDCNSLNIFSNRSQKWQVTISYYDTVWKEYKEININLFEATYNTVVWLLKNGYLKTENK